MFESAWVLLIPSKMDERDVCMLYSSVYIYLNEIVVVDDYDENNKDHLSFYRLFIRGFQIRSDCWASDTQRESESTKIHFDTF